VARRSRTSPGARVGDPDAGTGDPGVAFGFGDRGGGLGAGATATWLVDVPNDVTLLAATPDALFRVSEHDGDPDDAVVERTLPAGVRQVRAAGGIAYAATGSGVLESCDGGRTWTDGGLPAEDIHSVAVADDGVLAGTAPLAVYRLTEGTWTELDGLPALSADEGWPSGAHADEATARSLAVDGDRILVGVEVGGLAVRDADGPWRAAGPSEDDPGASQRRDDVHHVAVRGDGDWVVATGDGVYHTTDAGRSWARLETANRRYSRELLVDDLWLATNASPPRWRPPDAAVDRGRPGALSPVHYPGAPERFVVSWTRHDGAVYAGANDGAILRHAGGEWTTLATVPVSEHAETAFGVRSLATL
jgi:hypothetical protein